MKVDKTSKYDRQLRLWKDEGQTKLENSHICLINASPTGAEILKNLVLAGVGAITVNDQGLVNEDDLSGNFFYLREDIGKGKAESLVNNLVEMNNEVKRTAILNPLDDLLEGNKKFWDQFNVVVVSDWIPRKDFERLLDILWSRNIPLLLLNAVGFYGTLRLYVSEITIMETHDPARFHDLRICYPWTELQEYVDSIDLAEVDDVTHAHVPYVVILIKALEKWKQTHGGQLPSYRERTGDFRQLVKSMSRNIGEEENFIEASKVAVRALQLSDIPPHIQQLLQKANNNAEETLVSRNPIFWTLMKALKNFVLQNEGQLPLPGTLPDMTSDSASYTTLLNIYRSKALKDQENFKRDLMQVLASNGDAIKKIDEEVIVEFCKNTHFLHVTEGSKDLYNQELKYYFFYANGEDTLYLLNVYFAILGINVFIDRHNRNPIIEDMSEVQDLLREILNVPSEAELPIRFQNTLSEAILHYTNSYHNICSFMGGVCSQEILKLATSQYIPLDNLFVFDGIKSLSEKWKV